MAAWLITYPLLTVPQIVPLDAYVPARADDQY